MMIQPIPEDDPEILENPDYARMDAGEKFAHRRTLAVARHQHEEYLATMSQPKSWENRVELILLRQVELLEHIKTILAEIRDISSSAM